MSRSPVPGAPMSRSPVPGASLSRSPVPGATMSRSPVPGASLSRSPVPGAPASRFQRLRLLVTRRLNAAVEEILEAFEEAAFKYEEEAALSHEVISRQHALLCALSGPAADRPDRPDRPSADNFSQLLVSNKGDRPRDQERDQDQDQEGQQHQDLDLDQDQDQEGEQHQDLDQDRDQDQEGEQHQDLDEAEIIQFTYNARCAARPGSAEPAGSDDDVQLVSSETEDSEDYGRDPTDARPPPEQPRPKGVRRPAGRLSCRVCRRVFRARRFLIRHVRGHLQEEEPLCGLCGKRFEAAESLKLHFLSHLPGNRSAGRRHPEPDPDPKPGPTEVTCGDCGETFPQVWLKKKKHRCRVQRRNRKSPERKT